MFNIKLIEVYCVSCVLTLSQILLKGIFIVFSIFAIFPVKYKLFFMFLFKGGCNQMNRNHWYTYYDNWFKQRIY